MSRFKSGIQLRLLISFTLVTAIGGLVLFLIARRQLEDTSLQLYQLSSESEALTIANSLFNSIGEVDSESSSGAQALNSLLTQLRPAQDRDLTLFTPQLNVIGYTSTDPPEGLPASAPEITAAQSGHTGQDTRFDDSGIPFAYAAAPIGHEGEGIRAILQIKAPLQPAYDVAQSQSIQLASVWIPVVMVVAIVSLWIGQDITRPIRQLHRSAIRIADGALNERIDLNSSDEIGQLAQAFNYMVNRLNLLLAVQRSFVSNAAHELRAPLMSLSLRMEALQDKTLPIEQQQLYLHESVDELKHMSEMVTSLLTLARLDEGKYNITIEVFDVVALLRDIARNWRIQAQEAGLTLTVSVPDLLPLPRINPGDLRMVLDNLLSNALKYTPEGGEIRFLASNETGQLRIEVADTGIGFNPDEAEHLFERFYRSDYARSLSVMGTGLGLAIVHLLLKQYHAPLNISSQGRGQGATFVVCIPLA